MKVRLKPIVALLLSGCIAAPAFAASNQSLEASVAQLQKEVALLKKKQAHTNQASQSRVQPASRKAANTTLSPYSVDNAHDQYLPFDPDVPGQAYVSTGPYIGVDIQFNGSNLIVNSPSVNNDLQLLNIRKSIIQQLNTTLGESGIRPTHSHLLFSGVLETQAHYVNVGGAPSRTDIDLTNAALDATIFGPSDWILGFIEFNYFGGAPADDVFVSTSQFRTADSRVVINKAFVTLGDLLCSPFYATFGQFYVPFGTYSSVMLSDPLTKFVGRTKARAIQLGMMQQTPNAFYASVFAFRGDSHAHSVPKVSNGGINLGYKFKAGFISGNIGGGLLSNIADSGGMQYGTGFQYYEQMVHRVPAYDLRALISLGEHIDLIGEYVSASNRFNPNDMSFNNHGAQPSAFDLEASYSFPILDNKPSALGIAYSKSNQALAMGIPLTRTALVFNTSLMRNTLQGIELRRDLLYAASDVATGAGNSAVSAQSGKTDKAITLSFDYFF
jgi:hypothetical protein